MQKTKIKKQISSLLLVALVASNLFISQSLEVQAQESKTIPLAPTEQGAPDYARDFALFLTGSGAKDEEGNFLANGDKLQSYFGVFPRFGHTATKLNDGRILITGGSNGTNAIPYAHYYDPSTGNAETIGSHMRYARTRHTAHLMQDGNVVIIGGKTALSYVDRQLMAASNSSFRDKAKNFLTSMFGFLTQAEGGPELSTGEVFLAKEDRFISLKEYFLSKKTPGYEEFTAEPKMQCARSEFTTTYLPKTNQLLLLGAGDCGKYETVSQFIAPKPGSLFDNPFNTNPILFEASTTASTLDTSERAQINIQIHDRRYIKKSESAASVKLKITGPARFVRDSVTDKDLGEDVQYLETTLYPALGQGTYRVGLIGEGTDRNAVLVELDIKYADKTFEQLFRYKADPSRGRPEAPKETLSFAIMSDSGPGSEAYNNTREYVDKLKRQLEDLGHEVDTQSLPIDLRDRQEKATTLYNTREPDREETPEQRLEMQKIVSMLDVAGPRKDDEIKAHSQVKGLDGVIIVGTEADAGAGRKIYSVFARKERGNFSAAGEILDLNTGKFLPLPTDQLPLSLEHTATLVNDHQVIIAGGNYSTVTLYDAEDQTFTPITRMPTFGRVHALPQYDPKTKEVTKIHFVPSTRDLWTMNYNTADVLPPEDGMSYFQKNWYRFNREPNLADPLDEFKYGWGGQGIKRFDPSDTKKRLLSRVAYDVESAKFVEDSSPEEVGSEYTKAQAAYGKFINMTMFGRVARGLTNAINASWMIESTSEENALVQSMKNYHQTETINFTEIRPNVYFMITKGGYIVFDLLANTTQSIVRPTYMTPVADVSQQIPAQGYWAGRNDAHRMSRINVMALTDDQVFISGGMARGPRFGTVYNESGPSADSINFLRSKMDVMSEFQKKGVNGGAWAGLLAGNPIGGAASLIGFLGPHVVVALMQQAVKIDNTGFYDMVDSLMPSTLDAKASGVAYTFKLNPYADDINEQFAEANEEAQEDKKARLLPPPKEVLMDDSPKPDLKTAGKNSGYKIDITFEKSKLNPYPGAINKAVVKITDKDGRLVPQDTYVRISQDKQTQAEPSYFVLNPNDVGQGIYQVEGLESIRGLVSGAIRMTDYFYKDNKLAGGTYNFLTPDEASEVSGGLRTNSYLKITDGEGSFEFLTPYHAYKFATFEAEAYEALNPDGTYQVLGHNFGLETNSPVTTTKSLTYDSYQAATPPPADFQSYYSKPNDPEYYYRKIGGDPGYYYDIKVDKIVPAERGNRTTYTITAKSRNGQTLPENMRDHMMLKVEPGYRVFNKDKNQGPGYLTTHPAFMPIKSEVNDEVNKQCKRYNSTLGVCGRPAGNEMYMPIVYTGQPLTFEVQYTGEPTLAPYVTFEIEGQPSTLNENSYRGDKPRDILRHKIFVPYQNEK